MSLINDRIKNVRTEAGLSQEAFAEKIGLKRGNYSQIELGRQMPTLETISNIARIFSKEYSWLIDGEYSASGMLVNKDFSEKENKIPFYDTIAVGGHALLAATDPLYESAAEMIEPGTFFRSATGALRVYGHSMFPKYPAGCIIAFRDGTDFSIIHYGEDYVIELEGMRIVKRVQKSKNEAECIQVNSYNTMKDDTGSLVYAPYDIPKESIKRMYKVLGKIELEASI